MFKKSSVIYKIILVIILCFVIQMPILSFFVNYYSDKLVLEATGKTTMGMLQVVVSEIDSSRYEELAASLDMQDIYYEELRLYLMEKRDQFELKYLYTESFGADGNTLYIVDGNDMDNDDFSAIGEEVNTVDEVSDTDASINCLHHGIPGYEISTYDGITLLSTYYPIKNGTGKVIGILGADFDASEVKESKNEFLNIFSLMLAAIAVVICTLLAIILKLMLRPLFELKRSMEGIGKGDLTIQIPVKTRDEVGYIINEFNRSSMMQRNIIRSVINSTDTIDNSVSCINSSMENLEKSAAHLLGSTNALSELVDKNSSHTQELNSMSQTLTGSMQQIMTDSENGISVANTVGEKASKLSHSFTASQKQAESVFINTQDTLRKAIEDAKSVGQIGVLAETILSISKKTNLLAINASIEASAAGEAGKGFAVVADEIRVLATNSKDAVEKIKMTTGVVISSVTNLSNSTEVLLQFVNEQVNADYNEMLRVVTEYSRDAQQFKGILAGFETILKDLDSSVNTSVAAIEDISKIAVQSAESVQLIGEELNLINKTIKDVKTQTNESKESSAQLLAGVKNFKV